jgi:predicted nucleic acid-binding Zn ribbon protein
MTTCLICSQPLPQSRQKPRFCSTACRTAFHTGCRRVGELMFNEGKLDVEQIRRAAKNIG